jgi:hypothetical protein
MRTARLLMIGIALLALGGCAHDFRFRGDRAPILRAVQAHLRDQHVCLDYPPADGELPHAPEAYSVWGYRGRDGSFAWNAETRRKLDAFVSAGLMTVEERTFDRGEQSFAVRSYSRTDAAPTLPRRGLGPPAMCYGHAGLVRILKIEDFPPNGCLERRVTVSLLYAYSPFPAWVDHPAIAAAFPERMAGVDHDAVRVAYVPLRPAADGWAYDWPSNGYPLCLAEPRR